jgi:hypothetical protein
MGEVEQADHQNWTRPSTRIQRYSSVYGAVSRQQVAVQVQSTFKGGKPC